MFLVNKTHNPREIKTSESYEDNRQVPSTALCRENHWIFQNYSISSVFVIRSFSDPRWGSTFQTFAIALWRKRKIWIFSGRCNMFVCIQVVDALELIRAIPLRPPPPRPLEIWPLPPLFSHVADPPPRPLFFILYWTLTPFFFHRKNPPLFLKSPFCSFLIDLSSTHQTTLKKRGGSQPTPPCPLFFFLLPTPAPFLFRVGGNGMELTQYAKNNYFLNCLHIC